MRPPRELEATSTQRLRVCEFFVSPLTPSPHSAFPHSLEQCTVLLVTEVSQQASASHTVASRDKLSKQAVQTP